MTARNRFALAWIVGSVLASGAFAQVLSGPLSGPGEGSGGGVSGLETADGGDALRDNCIVRGDGTEGIQCSGWDVSDAGAWQFEGTADAFEFNVTVADPTADWTLTFGSGGHATFPGDITLPSGGHFIGSQGYFNGASGTEVAIVGNVGGYGILMTSDQPIGWFASATDVLTGSADAGFARNAGGVIRVTDGGGGINTRGLLGGGAAVASASALPVPTGNPFHVTGTTNIDSITTTNLQSGVCFTMIFDGVLTVGDANNLKLSGPLVTTADDTLNLCFDGSNFYEQGRSVN